MDQHDPKQCVVEGFVKAHMANFTPHGPALQAGFEAIRADLETKPFWPTTSPTQRHRILQHYYSHIMDQLEANLSKALADFAEASMGLSKDDQRASAEAFELELQLEAILGGEEPRA